MRAAIGGATKTPRRSQGAEPVARRACCRGLAVVARSRRRRAGERARNGISILRPGAAGGGRWARGCDGGPALYRRRSRRREAGGAVLVERAQTHTLGSRLLQVS